jgi:hypothetical protein
MKAKHTRACCIVENYWHRYILSIFDFLMIEANKSPDQWFSSSSPQSHVPSPGQGTSALEGGAGYVQPR